MRDKLQEVSKRIGVKRTEQRVAGLGMLASSERRQPRGRMLLHFGSFYVCLHVLLTCVHKYILDTFFFKSTNRAVVIVDVLCVATEVRNEWKSQSNFLVLQFRCVSDVKRTLSDAHLSQNPPTLVGRVRPACAGTR